MVALALYDTMGKASPGDGFGLGEEVFRAVGELAGFHFILAVVHAAWNIREFTMETQPLQASD